MIPSLEMSKFCFPTAEGSILLNLININAKLFVIIKILDWAGPLPSVWLLRETSKKGGKFFVNNPFAGNVKILFF